jgi:alpha-galactosidase
MRRSVPLLRSDFLFDPTGQQGHTYGLSFWLPFHGTAFSSASVYDPYSVRSQFCPHNTCCFDVRDPKLDYALIRRLQAERLAVVRYTLGDYYPLTPYDLGDDAWMAWQYHDPAKGEGAVQAFRRGASVFYGAALLLRGLDPEARYRRNLRDDGEGPDAGRAPHRHPGAARGRVDRLHEDMKSVAEWVSSPADSPPVGEGSAHVPWRRPHHE